MAQILRKTAKGQREVETRENRLGPRLRGALIIVDGRRTDQELVSLLPQDGVGTLNQLLTDGFIEVVAATATPAAGVPAAAAAARPAGPPAATPAAAAASAVDLAVLRRDAVRGLTEAVGPMGEALALRIEKARTMDELRPLLAMAMQVIGNTRGGGAAKAYGERLGVAA